jgi:hypothetical protein
MSCRKALLAVLALAVSTSFARAQTPPAPSEAAKAIVGAWELSNSDRDKRCGVTFSLDSAPGGLKLELEDVCATALPMLKDVVAWALGQNDVLRLIDGRGTAVFEFTEVESGLFEGERKGEGLYFLQTQAALKPDTRTAEEMFGDWRFLRELGKPLCTLALSKDKSGEDAYKLRQAGLRRHNRGDGTEHLAARPRPTRAYRTREHDALHRKRSHHMGASRSAPIRCC